MKWINFKNKLPKLGEVVDIYLKETGRETDYILVEEDGKLYLNPKPGRGGDWYVGFKNGWNDATHWMKIETPYKKKGKEDEN